MTRPPLTIAPIAWPADLDGAANGRLPAALLVQVGPGGTAGQLHHLAARAWRALVAAADAAGIDLGYSGAYRTYAQQESLFRSRYVARAEWEARRDEIAWSTSGLPSQVKFWAGAAWAKRRGVATAAVPGTSNHGWGLAVDLADDRDGGDFDSMGDAVAISSRSLDWLAVHARRFGWSWELLPEEPWHVRYVDGDRIPAAVLDHEASLQPPPIDPEEDDMAATARLYRDRRWQNIWLIGVGSALHLSPVLAGNYLAAGVPLVEDTHDQTLASLLTQSGITAADLVPQS